MTEKKVLQYRRGSLTYLEKGMSSVLGCWGVTRGGGRERTPGKIAWGRNSEEKFKIRGVWSKRKGRK